jgi:hypothetical protein
MENTMRHIEAPHFDKEKYTKQIERIAAIAEEAKEKVDFDSAHDPEVLKAIHSVLPGIERVDLEPIFAHKLTSLGLVKQLESSFVSSCELYRQFFLNHQNYAL